MVNMSKCTKQNYKAEGFWSLALRSRWIQVHFFHQYATTRLYRKTCGTTEYCSNTIFCKPYGHRIYMIHYDVFSIVYPFPADLKFHCEQDERNVPFFLFNITYLGTQKVILLKCCLIINMTNGVKMAYIEGIWNISNMRFKIYTTSFSNIGGMR